MIWHENSKYFPLPPLLALQTFCIIRCILIACISHPISLTSLSLLFSNPLLYLSECSKRFPDTTIKVARSLRYSVPYFHFLFLDILYHPHQPSTIPVFSPFPTYSIVRLVQTMHHSSQHFLPASFTLLFLVLLSQVFYLHITIPFLYEVPSLSPTFHSHFLHPQSNSISHLSLS